jgi:hypothetical protein
MLATSIHLVYEHLTPQIAVCSEAEVDSETEIEDNLKKVSDSSFTIFHEFQRNFYGIHAANYYSAISIGIATEPPETV